MNFNPDKNPLYLHQDQDSSISSDLGHIPSVLHKEGTNKKFGPCGLRPGNLFVEDKPVEGKYTNLAVFIKIYFTK